MIGNVGVFIAIIALSSNVHVSAAPSPDPGLGLLLDGLSQALSPVLSPVVSILNILTADLGGVNGTLGTLNALTNGILADLLAPLSPLTSPLGLGVPPNNVTNSLAGILSLLPALTLGTGSGNMSGNSTSRYFFSGNPLDPMGLFPPPSMGPLANLPIIGPLILGPLGTILNTLLPGFLG